MSSLPSPLGLFQFFVDTGTIAVPAVLPPVLRFFQMWAGVFS